jgi:hypothetical protein
MERERQQKGKRMFLYNYKITTTPKQADGTVSMDVSDMNPQASIKKKKLTVPASALVVPKKDIKAGSEIKIYVPNFFSYGFAGFIDNAPVFCNILEESFVKQLGLDVKGYEKVIKDFADLYMKSAGKNDAAAERLETANNILVPNCTGLRDYQNSLRQRKVI